MASNTKPSAAARALFDAAGRVPIVKRGDTEPFSTCLGCGMTDGEACAAGCWVYALDVARGQLAWEMVEDSTPMPCAAPWPPQVRQRVRRRPVSIGGTVIDIDEGDGCPLMILWDDGTRSAEAVSDVVPDASPIATSSRGTSALSSCLACGNTRGNFVRGLCHDLHACNAREQKLAGPDGWRRSSPFTSAVKP